MGCNSMKSTIFYTASFLIAASLAIYVAWKVACARAWSRQERKLESERHPLIKAALRGDLAGVQGQLGLGVPADTLDVDPAPGIQHCLEGGQPRRDFDQTKTRTALMIAAGMGRADIAAVLIDAGADVNFQNRVGNTPLGSATSHIELVKLLLNHGADPHNCTTFGSTMLNDVALDRDLEVARFLIEAGCDVNEQDDSGDTPLITAVWTSRINLDMVRLFLDAGADANIANRDGKTAIDIAKEMKATDVVKMLLDASRI